MDVWCKAICCRHINFKAVFQSTSEHAIFIQKIEKFSREGHSPLPKVPPSPVKGETPLAYIRRRLDRRTFGAQPLARLPKS